MHGSACVRGKKPNLQRQEQFPCKKQQQSLVFDLGQLVATPGALASLAKAGQTPLDFLSKPRMRRLGRHRRRRPEGERTRPQTRLSASQQLPHERRRTKSGLSPKRPFRNHRSFARRILIQPQEEKKEKSKMNTALAMNTGNAVPLVASLVQDIPLHRIRESKTNPRRQFDEIKLADPTSASMAS